MHVETYQVLNAGQVSVPSYCSLEEFTFEAEFPSRSYHYLESGARADADYYEKMFRSAQKELTRYSLSHPTISRTISACVCW